MSFAEEARDEMIDHLVAHTKKNKEAIRQELRALAPVDVAIRYFNWLLRLVPPQPRRVHVAKGAYNHPALDELGAEFASLLAKLEQGDDVNAYLSEGVTTEAYSSQSRSDSFDKDGLLNHWGIHHLHFHPVDQKNARKTRGNGRLLFSVIRPADAYIVAVGNHSSFADQELLAIARREWPNLRLVEPLKGAITLQRERSPSQVVELRKAGINALTMIDGQVYMTGAVSSAGTSDEAWHRSRRLMRCLKWLQAWCAENEHLLRKHIVKAGRQPAERLDLGVKIAWDRIFLSEANSGVTFQFPDM